MEDLKQAYTEDELNNMKLPEFALIRHIIEEYVKNFFTEEEHSTIEKAKKISQAPYHYSLNKAYYTMGKEFEAEQREFEIEKTIQDANKLQEKIRNEMPPNLKETCSALEKVINSPIQRAIKNKMNA